MNTIKDYEEEEQLQAEELEHFKGAIIVIGMIFMCLLIILLSYIGWIRG